MSDLSSARHSGMQVRQLQPRFKQLSCWETDGHCVCYAAVGRDCLTDFRLTSPGGRDWSELFFAERLCRKWSFPIPPGKTSRLLLSNDRLRVCERRAFTIAPSPPIFVVYRHVVIAMEIK